MDYAVLFFFSFFLSFFSRRLLSAALYRPLVARQTLQLRNIDPVRIIASSLARNSTDRAPCSTRGSLNTLHPLRQAIKCPWLHPDPRPLRSI
jgi:hypothetical protein